MSSVGKCARSLWAETKQLSSLEKPPWLDEAAEEGRVHEQLVKTRLTKLGYDIYEEGECRTCKNGAIGIHVEIDLKDKQWKLIGHMDGRATKLPDTKQKVLEVKSMSQFEFDRWMKGKFEQFPKYADQLTCYMYADKCNKAIYAVKNRNNGYLDSFEQIGQPSDIKMIFDKLDLVVESVDTNTMPESEPDFSSFECRRCLYRELCISKLPIESVHDETLIPYVEMWRKGIQLQHEADDLIEEARKKFYDQTVATKRKYWIIEGLGISLITKDYTNYDKKILLELFTQKQLKPAEKPIHQEYVNIQEIKR